MVVATATTPDRKIVVVNLTNPQTIYNQIPSPLKQSVEVIVQNRAQRTQRHPVNTVDRELAPSYLSRQSSALVQDWDYVRADGAPGGGGGGAAASAGAGSSYRTNQRMH